MSLHACAAVCLTLTTRGVESPRTQRSSSQRKGGSKRGHPVENFVPFSTECLSGPFVPRTREPSNVPADSTAYTDHLVSYAVIICRQTADYCLKELDEGQVLQHREDPRLREQEFKGTFQDEEMEESKRLRALYGSFFFRFPNGESAADVYDRVSVFMDTLWRDFATYDLSDTAVVIFTHGLTARIFLMRWFRWSSDDFQTSRNPRNGAMMVMERIADPFEPGRTTMELRADARELLSIKPELCYTIRDRQITTLELPP